MIVELLPSENDQTYFVNMNDKQRKSIRTFRYYLDNRFGHGFWHVMVHSVPYVGPLYLNNQVVDNDTFRDLMYDVSRKVNLDINYLIEDYNLFRFKR